MGESASLKSFHRNDEWDPEEGVMKEKKRRKCESQSNPGGLRKNLKEEKVQ